jgi:hypothetical protein
MLVYLILILLTTSILYFLAHSKKLHGSFRQAVVAASVSYRALIPSAGDVIGITLEADVVSD